MSTIFSSSDLKNDENANFSKDRPFIGKIKKRQLLNKQGSSKKTYHVTIDISGSNLSYQEGDAIAIFPSNPKNLVEILIDYFNAQSSTLVTFSKKSQTKTLTLLECLSDYVNITRVSPQLFDLIKTFSSCQDCKAQLEILSLLEKKEEKLAFMQSHDVVSLVKKAKSLSCAVQDFIDTLSPLLPRFYSIASSQIQDRESVDLLVATFAYQVHGENRSGIGSEFLSTLATEQTPVPLYIHCNPNFKLPDDIKRPIIMVGPGTGLAPFRAFIQKRISIDPLSKNWLFFGERNKSCDFYYQEELTQLENHGCLKLSLAFSRDQEKKIYVQDKLLEHQKEIWSWIQNGAFIYICGDAKNMAKDVLNTFCAIFTMEGHMSEQEAKNYLSYLRKAKQLQTDIY